MPLSFDLVNFAVGRRIFNVEKDEYKKKKEIHTDGGEHSQRVQKRSSQIPFVLLHVIVHDDGASCWPIALCLLLCIHFVGQFAN